MVIAVALVSLLAAAGALAFAGSRVARAAGIVARLRPGSIREPAHALDAEADALAGSVAGRTRR
jgi:hypothetical protein